MAGSAEKTAWLVSVPKPLRERWTAFARQQGLSAQELLRLVMARVVDQEGAQAASIEAAPRAPEKPVTMRVKLWPEEVRRVDAIRATGEGGGSRSGWVAALIRSRIAGAPLMTGAEIEALEKSTLQLAAIGRNLNAVVHRLHKEGQWYPDSADIQGLARKVGKHLRDHHRLTELAVVRGQF